MQATLGQLCETLSQSGLRADLRGDAGRVIHGVNTLEDAAEGELSFLTNPKYERLLATTRASAVVIKPDVSAPPHLDLLKVNDPYAAIATLIVRLHGHREHRKVPAPAGQAFVSPTARVGEGAILYPGAVIDEEAEIGQRAVLYPGAYVGPRCRLGDDVVLYPNVVLYEDTILGNRVTIHAGSVIGEDGLGYAPVNGKWVKIPQIGRVEIGDDVEIGANCTLDRATVGRTTIGPGTKFSNLIAIGHGTHIGAHCMFVAQVGLAGSVTVGERVTMAGQAGVVGHIRVGDGATVGAKAGVTNNVPDGETVLGQPAIPIRDMRRQVAHVMRLPELNETVKRLEKRIADLESRLTQQPADRPQA